MAANPTGGVTCAILRIRHHFVVRMCSTTGPISVFESYLEEKSMCPLCITAGTLYLAGVGAGSAGGLAAVATKVMRGRRGRKGKSSGGAYPGSTAPLPRTGQEQDPHQASKR